MEISTEVTEIKSYEPIDKEPYHYIGLVRSTVGSWLSIYAYPMTSREALERSMRESWGGYLEGRIIKIRLPTS